MFDKPIYVGFSLTYEIKLKDVYEEFFKYKHVSDFSEYI